jgi:hypothetical protein
MPEYAFSVSYAVSSTSIVHAHVTVTTTLPHTLRMNVSGDAEGAGGGAGETITISSTTISGLLDQIGCVPYGADTLRGQPGLNVSGRTDRSMASRRSASGEYGVIPATSDEHEYTGMPSAGFARSNQSARTTATESETTQFRRDEYGGVVAFPPSPSANTTGSRTVETVIGHFVQPAGEDMFIDDGSGMADGGDDELANVDPDRMCKVCGLWPSTAMMTKNGASGKAREVVPVCRDCLIAEERRVGLDTTALMLSGRSPFAGETPAKTNLGSSWSTVPSPASSTSSSPRWNDSREASPRSGAPRSRPALLSSRDAVPGSRTHIPLTHSPRRIAEDSVKSTSSSPRSDDGVISSSTSISRACCDRCGRTPVAARIKFENSDRNWLFCRGCTLQAREEHEAASAIVNPRIGMRRHRSSEVHQTASPPRPSRTLPLPATNAPKGREDTMARCERCEIRYAVARVKFKSKLRKLCQTCLDVGLELAQQMPGFSSLRVPALCAHCNSFRPKAKVQREKDGITFTIWLCKNCTMSAQSAFVRSVTISPS